jgi:hypothetical protein
LKVEANKDYQNRREEWDMLRMREVLKAGMVGVAVTLLATPAFARSIDLKGAGTALWIFLIVGAVIVLLQLIPAAILFFSFIGTATTMALKKEKKVEEEMVVPGAEPVAVKKWGWMNRILPLKNAGETMLRRLRIEWPRGVSEVWMGIQNPDDFRASREEGSKMIKLSASSVVGLIILMCILAAMVSIAIMQVVRTVEDIGPKIYIVGGAVALVGIAIPVMLIILVQHLKKTS